jgi:hypothetical protein
MTTFTTIPNSSLEPGKPIRSIDGLALRDNPIAIAEGDSAAPRIVGKAVMLFSQYPVLTVSASSAYIAEIGAGSEAVTPVTTAVSDPPSTVARRYTISKYTGSMRFNISHSAIDGGTVYLAAYKNSTLIQSYSTSSSAQRTVDISVSPGDIIEWRHSAFAGNTSQTSNPFVMASNAYTTRLLYISESDAVNP